jgi:hypothetical protein
MIGTSSKICILISALLIILVFSKCKEDEEASDGWSNCLDCTVTEWVGNYEGTGDFFDYTSNSTTNGIPVSVEIEETAPEYLTVYFHSPNYLSVTISGSLVSNYIISFAGSGSSVTATLNVRDQDYKLSGNAKKFHYHSDSLVMDEMVNFEVLKNIN